MKDVEKLAAEDNNNKTVKNILGMKLEELDGGESVIDTDATNYTDKELFQVQVSYSKLFEDNFNEQEKSFFVRDLLSDGHSIEFSM